MKLKVALVSPQREDVQQLKQAYPDLNILHARNVLELVQTHGHQNLNAIIFWKVEQLEKDFSSFLNYLRGKSNFAKTPVALLSDKPLFFLKPFSDTLVRFYKTDGGLFLALLNFFNSVMESGKLEGLITPDRIEKEFEQTLQDKLGQGTGFIAHQITSDEARESFFSQKSGEVSTHLVWMKFALRILDKGSEALKQNFAGLSEDEMSEAGEKILEKAFYDFQFRLESSLKESGAIHFVPSDQMIPQDRSPFMKMSKSTFIRFDSSVCSILLEMIRYI